MFVCVARLDFVNDTHQVCWISVHLARALSSDDHKTAKTFHKKTQQDMDIIATRRRGAPFLPNNGQYKRCRSDRYGKGLIIVGFIMSSYRVAVYVFILNAFLKNKVF